MRVGLVRVPHWLGWAVSLEAAWVPLHCWVFRSEPISVVDGLNSINMYQ